MPVACLKQNSALRWRYRRARRHRVWPGWVLKSLGRLSLARSQGTWCRVGQSRKTTLTSRPSAAWRSLRRLSFCFWTDAPWSRQTGTGLVLRRSGHEWPIVIAYQKKGRGATLFHADRRWSHAARLASSTAPAKLEALLPHLFASGFPHPLVDSFLRLGLPMTFPRGIDWSPTTADDRGCCRHDRCLSLWPVFSSQVSQQVDGGIPNAAQFGGQYDAVKRTLAFSPNRCDEHAELVCKRDKPLFDEISAQLSFGCGRRHCHDSSLKRIDWAARWYTGMCPAARRRYSRTYCHRRAAS